MQQGQLLLFQQLEGLSPGPDSHHPLSFWAAETVGDKRLMLMREHVKPEL